MANFLIASVACGFVGAVGGGSYVLCQELDKKHHNLDRAFNTFEAAGKGLIIGGAVPYVAVAGVIFGAPIVLGGGACYLLKPKIKSLLNKAKDQQPETDK